MQPNQPSVVWMHCMLPPPSLPLSRSTANGHRNSMHSNSRKPNEGGLPIYIKQLFNSKRSLNEDSRITSRPFVGASTRLQANARVVGQNRHTFEPLGSPLRAIGRIEVVSGRMWVTLEEKEQPNENRDRGDCQGMGWWPQ
eukprot:TRINITY_DN1279_c0_g1_i1.p4 TRINITY_DN1279_c0_g1~~TRINITY_DN1279_c0_g1_i1.p4  ORF type:complete len:140 (+),score=8.85 TRINITY_DN1279_c0_g1_i1:691-1110(+)